MGTFVLAGRGADGAVMVADRRVVDRQRMELVSDMERKAFVIGDKLVLAFDGANVVWTDIVADLQGAMGRGEIEAFEDAVGIVRDSFRNAWNRYAAAFPEEMQFTGFLAGLSELTSGTAQLVMVGPGGLVDDIPEFQPGGAAGLRSQTLVRLLWRREMPVDDLWPLGVFCCGYTASFDLTVGGVPTVHVIRDTEGIEEVQPDSVARVLAAVEGAAARLPGQLLAAVRSPDI